MKTGVIYARVSTQEQADSRLGLQSQERTAVEFAISRGYVLPREHELVSHAVSATEALNLISRVQTILVDAGVSGSIPLLARPAGSQILKLRDTTVIALTQDRFFRSVADMLATIEALDENRVDLVTVDEGLLDFSDDDRWLGTMMRAVFAEFERRKVSSRTKRALQSIRDRGGKIGEAPYGWMNIGNAQHAPNVEEQIIVKMILDRAANGVPLRAIARALNDNGHRTRGGGEWTHTQVGRIIDRDESRHPMGYDGIITGITP